MTTCSRRSGRCASAMTAKLAGSVPIPDHAGHLGGKFGIGQQQVDERCNDLLSGDPGESETVSGFSLPDVESSVCGGPQVNGPSCSLAARRWCGVLMNAREAFGRCRSVRALFGLGSERRGAGFHADRRPSVGSVSVAQDISMSVMAVLCSDYATCRPALLPRQKSSSVFVFAISIIRHAGSVTTEISMHVCHEANDQQKQ